MAAALDGDFEFLLEHQNIVEECAPPIATSVSSIYCALIRSVFATAKSEAPLPGYWHCEYKFAFDVSQARGLDSNCSCPRALALEKNSETEAVIGEDHCGGCGTFRLAAQLRLPHARLPLPLLRPVGDARAQHLYEREAWASATPSMIIAARPLGSPGIVARTKSAPAASAIATDRKVAAPSPRGPSRAFPIGFGGWRSPAPGSCRRSGYP